MRWAETAEYMVRKNENRKQHDKDLLRFLERLYKWDLLFTVYPTFMKDDTEIKFEWRDDIGRRLKDGRKCTPSAHEIDRLADILEEHGETVNERNYLEGKITLTNMYE